MAVFQLNDEETWLPAFAKGRGIKAKHVRVHNKNGTRTKHLLHPVTRQVEVTDERAIRHLDADPKYTRIS